LASPASTHALAQGLGWFSIGLGLVELLAPRRLASSLGMEEHSGLIQAYGAREIATGVGILAQRDPTPWIWGRVAGDALDLATLAAVVPNNPRKGNALLAMAAVAGVAALDLLCARELRAHQQERERRRTYRDYSNRSGFSRTIAEVRGAARDFEIPKDMRIPEALRPWKDGKPAGNDNVTTGSSSGGVTSAGVKVPEPTESNLKPQLSSTQMVKTANQTVT
jgi:hypothetical protein